MRFQAFRQANPRLVPGMETAVWAGAGFLAGLLAIGDRAPLSIALTAAAAGRKNILAALCGGALAAALTMEFTAALRHCGILVLLYAAFSAFRGTAYIEHELFRPVAAAVMTAVVELAYLLQEGLSLSAFAGYAAYLLLVGAVTHYLCLLRERRRQSGREGVAATLRRRLELSAAAFRDLYNSLGKPAAPRNDENPAVVFDRAAEVVCRSCKECLGCWERDYIDTFNALNDATPAMLRRGKSLAEDYPEHFRERCVKFPQFLSAVNQEVTALLLRRQYGRRLEQERQRARGQYAQLSEFLGQAARQVEAAVPAMGGACACKVGGAWRPKDGESVCGDTITHFETEDGGFYLLLSDGMGSGEEAHRESVNTVRLLEQFLRAGVEAASALKTVNAAMSLKGEDTGRFATVDLLSLDRRTREAALYKYGAAPTYLKRHGSVRKITGTGLPAGLQEVSQVPPAIRFPLEPDSFLVLISDGVADPGDDEWLQNLLAGWQGEEPQRLVSLILSESRSHGGLRDDCSVLCLYLPPSGRQV